MLIFSGSSLPQLQATQTCGFSQAGGLPVFKGSGSDSKARGSSHVHLLLLHYTNGEMKTAQNQQQKKLKSLSFTRVILRKRS